MIFNSVQEETIPELSIDRRGKVRHSPFICRPIAHYFSSKVIQRVLHNWRENKNNKKAKQHDIAVAK